MNWIQNDNQNVDGFEQHPPLRCTVTSLRNEIMHSTALLDNEKHFKSPTRTHTCPYVHIILCVSSYRLSCCMVVYSTLVHFVLIASQFREISGLL